MKRGKPAASATERNAPTPYQLGCQARWPLGRSRDACQLHDPQDRAQWLAGWDFVDANEKAKEWRLAERRAAWEEQGNG